MLKNKKIKTVIYIVCLTMCFMLGSKIWKIYRSSSLYDSSNLEDISDKSKILAYVGDSTILRDDLEAYYYIQTKDVATLIKEDDFLDYHSVKKADDTNNKDQKIDSNKNESEKHGVAKKISSFFSKDDEDKETQKTLEKSRFSLKETILTRLIERELLYKMVLKSGVDIKDQQKQCQKDWIKYEDVYKPGKNLSKKLVEVVKEGVCKDKIVSDFLDKQYYSKIEVTEEELRKYYEEHKSKYELPERVLVRQIVLATEAEAIEVQNGLTRSNFEQRVEKYSISVDKERGGLVGPFSKGQMPHFFDVAFLMHKGQIQGVVKSDYGFHLFLLEGKYPAKKLTFNETKKDVQENVVGIKKEEAYQKLIDTALSSFKVETVRVGL